MHGAHYRADHLVYMLLLDIKHVLQAPQEPKVDRDTGGIKTMQNGAMST